MVDIRPFKDYSYAPSSVADLSTIIAPPYDVISDQERAGYQLGRKEKSDIAAGLIRVDSDPSPDLVEKISSLDEVISAKFIALD